MWRHQVFFVWGDIWRIADHYIELQTPVDDQFPFEDVGLNKVDVQFEGFCIPLCDSQCSCRDIQCVDICVRERLFQCQCNASTPCPDVDDCDVGQILVLLD